MSYFFAPNSSFDGFADKRIKRKSKEKSYLREADDDHSRGSSRNRHHKHSTSGTKASSSKSNEECILSPERKNRHVRFKEEINRLSSENNVLSSKIDNFNSSDASFKEASSLIKAKSKCQKLEKSCEDLELDRDRLKSSLKDKENNYNELERRYEEVKKFLQSLEIENSGLTTINEKINLECSQLNEDVVLLKSVVYRLNVQLERCQSFGGNNHTDDVCPDPKKLAKSWGSVDVHALGPLLNAYEESISEKDELLKKYEQEISRFSSRCKEIVTENEQLQLEIDDLKFKNEKYSVDLKTLSRDASVVKEQNDMLTKQMTMHKDKLQEVHGVYERKVESMSQDNNKLQRDFIACKTELSNLSGKYEILNDSYEKLKSNSEKTVPVSVHNSAVDECRRLFEELKYQYDTEKKKLNAKLKQYEETIPDNEKQLLTVTTERDHLQLLNGKLEKSLKSTQKRLDQLKNNLYSLQIARDSFKRQLNKTTSFCKELVAEQERLLEENNKLQNLLTVREKETKDIQCIGENIAQRMETLKSQLKSVQKGAQLQLASVEKRIRVKELGADRVKAEYDRELARLKHLLKEKERVIGRLQREKSATQDNLEVVWKAATSDDKRLKDALKGANLYDSPKQQLTTAGKSKTSIVQQHQRQNDSQDSAVI